MRPSVVLALALVAAAVLLAWVGESLTPYAATTTLLTERLRPPSPMTGGMAEHLLGTDALGRDLLTRLFVGLRASLLAGLAGVLVAGVLGTTVGLVAGYFRGPVESVLMTVVDVKLALPSILLAIGIIAVFGSSLTVLVVVIGLGLWVGFARIVRSVVVTVRAEEFVTAARAVGAHERHIILRHILPSAVTPILIMATLNVPTAITLEASLSFLGIGIQPPTPSLGNMIAEGRSYIANAAYLVVIPSVVLVALTLSITQVGDWVAEKLDPMSVMAAR